MTARVVVIVLTHNQWDLTRACLSAITLGVNDQVRVLVVDNVSTDGTPAHVRELFPQVEVIENKTNLGYAQGNNVGLLYAMERNLEYAMILNNDATVAADCVKTLLEAGDANPDAALLGPLVYHAQEPDVIQSAGGILPTNWHAYHRGANQRDEHQFRETANVDWLTGCAVLARSSALRSFGLLDDNFFMYGEDVDWGIRARRAGFRVLLVPQARVWHSGVQRDYTPTPNVTYYTARNELQLIQKHHAGMSPLVRAWARNLRTVASWSVRPRWSGQGAQRDALARALRDAALHRMGRAGIALMHVMQLLFVSSWFPFPPDNGSRIRAYNLLKTLATKNDVTLLAFTDPDFLPEHAAAIQEMGVRVITTPRIAFQPKRGRALAAFLSPQPRFLVDTYSGAMEHLIDDELARVKTDVLVMGQLSAAVYARSSMPPAKIFDELETGIFYDAYVEAHGTTRWRRALTWWKMARYLRTQAGVFDAVTVVSERERQLANRLGISDKRLTVLPNAIDGATYENVSATREPNTLIYSGALTYGANLDAMRYFVREILPLIREREPSTRLTITGRADQVAINELSGDNAVLFAGYVPDVRPWIARSSVCIVPLRLGGGTRLKILEAMALGTPVVSTSKGIEGLELVEGQDVLLGNTPQDFASKVVRLLGDAELREQIARNARAQVYARYDWKHVENTLNDLIVRITRRAGNENG